MALKLPHETQHKPNAAEEFYGFWENKLDTAPNNMEPVDTARDSKIFTIQMRMQALIERTYLESGIVLPVDVCSNFFGMRNELVECFYDFAIEANNVQEVQKLVSLLEIAAALGDFPAISYMQISSNKFCLTTTATCLSNYPSKWKKYYEKNKCRNIDPILIFTPIIKNPYLWNDLKTNFKLNQEQTRFLRAAEKAGLRDSVSVPLHGPEGLTSVLSFSSTNTKSKPDNYLVWLNALALHFHVSFLRIHKKCNSDGDKELTSREKECLIWVSQGKSSWDIGQILSVSENTVNFHIKNIMKKFNVTSRTVAVLTAKKLNLI